MKGLILKDFLLLKQCKQVFSLLFFYIVLGLFINQFNLMCALLIMYTSMFVLTTFSYDTYCKWEKYSLCFPISRKEVVLSKYLFFLFILACTILVSFLFSILFFIFKNQLTDKEVLLEIVFSILSVVTYSVFFISIMFPIIFKIGVEKSRMFMMIIMVVPFLLLAFLGYNHMISIPNQLSEQTFMLFIGALFLLSFLALALSFLLSLKIFVKKDL